MGSVVFRWCVTTFTRLFSGHADYAASPGAGNPHVPWLRPYFVLLAPVVGSLLYGPLVHRFAKEARGHGVPEVTLAVAQRGGRISPKVAVVKTLASALTIGSGGSVGREGPIVQIGSALGATLGRVTRVTEGRMKLLVACGAAGGIAATFNAPLAGVFFAMELILGTFSAEAFGATVLPSETDLVPEAASAPSETATALLFETACGVPAGRHGMVGCPALPDVRQSRGVTCDRRSRVWGWALRRGRVRHRRPGVGRG